MKQSIFLWACLATVAVGCSNRTTDSETETDSSEEIATVSSADTGEPEAPEDTGTGTETEAAVSSCVDVVCNQSPPNTCNGVSSLNVFNGIGWCEGGSCVYGGRFETCVSGLCESGNCVESLCQGIRCNDPPPDECLDDQTLIVYATAGYCSEVAGEPSCHYTSIEVPCADGCGAGHCMEEDPCLRTICKDEPARYCDTTGDLIVWDNQPTCVSAIARGANYW